MFFDEEKFKRELSDDERKCYEKYRKCCTFLVRVGRKPESRHKHIWGFVTERDCDVLDYRGLPYTYGVYVFTFYKRFVFLWRYPIIRLPFLHYLGCFATKEKLKTPCRIESRLMMIPAHDGEAERIKNILQNESKGH